MLIKDPSNMSKRPSLQFQINDIADAIERAKRIVFFTGAGISADSGLPTYRGVGGLYNDMTVDEGLPIETVLSGEMFRRDPVVTWKYIAQIERACRGAEANEAHKFIAELESVADTWVITQNVDGFHVDAGSSRVVELHGNLRRLKCLNCNHHMHVDDYSELSIPPCCFRCSSTMRPDVVLFGEYLPEKATIDFEREISRGFDVVFSVGTSAGFPYIYQPITDAAAMGIPTIEINPEQTDLSRIVKFHLECGAVEALVPLRNELRSRKILG